MYTSLKRLALLAPLLLSACVLSNETIKPGAQAPEAVRCEESTQCPTHLPSCQFNLCVDGPENAAAMRVAAMISPPNDRQDLARLTLLDFEFDPGQALTIGLERSVTANGQLRTKTGEIVSGVWSLYFSKADDLTGRKFSASTETDNNGKFSLQLPPGRYNLTLSNEDSELPSHRQQIQIESGSDAKEITVIAPKEEDFIRWNGRLVRLNKELETRGIEGVTIWATSEDGSVQSTIVQSDARGVFSFLLHGDVKNFQLHTRSTTIEQDGETFLIPSASSSLYNNEQKSDYSKLDLPGYEWSLGQLYPAMRIHGVVLDEHDYPVANAKVLAQASLITTTLEEKSNLQGTLRRANIQARATTERDGSFEFLFPAVNGVRLTAISSGKTVRLSDPDRSVQLYDTGKSEAGPFVLRVAAGQQLSVEVFSSQQHPLSEFEARVDLQSSSLLSASYFDMNAEELSTQYSHESGISFFPRVFHGYWDVSIAPAVQKNLPLWTERIWLEGERLPKNLQIQLPPGIAGRIQIIDPEGEPLRGATVELFQVADDGSEKPFTLGKATSNADGNATMILPYQLPKVH